MINDCMRCGRTHRINDFPAYGKKCGNCGIFNYFKLKCRRNIGENNKQIDK